VQPDPGSPGAALTSALLRVLQRVRQAEHDDPVDRSAVVLLARLHEHGPLRLSDLAALLFLDVSTVSRHARSLEDRGFVARADDPDDGRAVRLRLTPGGERVLEKAFANRQAWLDGCIADWSDDERRRLAEDLDRLADALTRRPAQPDQ
jgi:DNA-binding MarR family transcriptional regulator